MASTRPLPELARGGAVAAVLVTLFSASPALAHFALKAPESWMSQDNLGLPEKLGPCGDEDDGTAAATPTGVVTTFQQGQTITITIDELIFHPGHYRIALAVNDRSELPAEPAVTAGATPCGTAAIETPAVFPVLADNVFPHTTPFTAPQTVQVTLPSDVTCTKCTLQIIEFMSAHALNNPGGCFYHHCADISLQPADAGGGTGTTGGDAGDAGDAGTGMTSADASQSDGGGGAASGSSGCGCSSAPSGVSPAGWLVGAAVVGSLVRRRRAKWNR